MLELCFKYGNMVSSISCSSFTSRSFGLEFSQSPICYLYWYSEYESKVFLSHLFLKLEYLIAHLSFSLSEKNWIFYLVIFWETITNTLEIVVPLVAHLVLVFVLFKTIFLAILYDYIVEIGIIWSTICRDTFQEKFVDNIDRIGIDFFIFSVLKTSLLKLWHWGHYFVNESFFTKTSHRGFITFS